MDREVEGSTRATASTSVSRVIAIALLATVTAGCSLLPLERERPRAEQMQNAVLPIAKAALDAGQVETARRLYRRLLQVEQSSFEARMGLGDAAVADRESAEAARWYLAALGNARQPDERHAALLAHGRAALSDGQLEAARKSFARLTRADENAPEMVVAWGFNGLGLTLLLAGDLDNAVAAMEQAVLRAPDERRFEGNLSRALAMRTELEEQGVAVGGRQTLPGRVDVWTLPETPVAPTEPIPTTPESSSTGVPAPAAADSAESPGARQPEAVARMPEAVADGESPAGEDLAAPTTVAELLREEPARASQPVGPPPREDTRVPRIDTLPEIAYDSQDEVPEAVRAGADEPLPEGTGEPTASTPAVEPTTLSQAAQVDESLPEGTVEPSARAPITDSTVLSRAEEDEGLSQANTERAAPTPIIDPTALSQAEEVDGALPEDRVQPSPRRHIVDSTTLQPADDDTVRVERASTDDEPIVVIEDGWTFVQVAAYVSLQRAAELSQRLRAVTDHPVAGAEMTDPDGRRLSRVRIGPVPSDEKLRDLAVALEAHGFGTLSLRTAPDRPYRAAPGPPLVVEDEGGLWVQAGAYAVKPSAEELAARLSALTGHPTLVAGIASSGEEAVYRVRIGPLTSGETLADVADTLDAHGYGRARIPTGAKDEPSPRIAAPSPPMIVREGGGRFVQTGAYQSRWNAEEAADRVRGLTEHQVEISEGTGSEGQQLFRVHVGPMSSGEEVLDLKEALELAGHGATNVSPEE